MNSRNVLPFILLYIITLFGIQECNNWMYLGISSLGTSSFPYSRFNDYRRFQDQTFSTYNHSSLEAVLKLRQKQERKPQDFAYYDELGSDGPAKNDFALEFDQPQLNPQHPDGMELKRSKMDFRSVASGPNAHSYEKPPFSLNSPLHTVPAAMDRSEEVCTKSFRDRLVSTQLQVCQNHPESLICVSQGARMALAECQRQFRNERWNCSAALIQTAPRDRRMGVVRMSRMRNYGSRRSGQRLKRDSINFARSKMNYQKPSLDYEDSINYKKYKNDKYFTTSQGGDGNVKVINVLSKTLEKGTKESAFIYATASAAVVHAVTQSCSAGNLTDCSCRIVGQAEKSIYDKAKDPLDRGEWKWGGCSDNIDYGIKFSREFVDAPDNEQIMSILAYYGQVDPKDSTNNSIPTPLNLSSKLNIASQTDQIIKGSSGSTVAKSNIPKPTFSFPYTRVNKQIVRHLINLHNNEMGRRAIGSLIQKQCRCHGVSGSCELKTCWLNMPPFANIGAFIKSKYHNSVRVLPSVNIKPNPNLTHSSTPHPSQISSFISNNLMLKPRPTRANQSIIEDDLLVHMDKSPNYCRVRLESGVFGTKGRLCNATSKGTDGCDYLCCGRGFETHHNIRQERCHCKFVWCCYVNCNTCQSIETTHTCK